MYLFEGLGLLLKPRCYVFIINGAKRNLETILTYGDKHKRSGDELPCVLDLKLSAKCCDFDNVKVLLMKCQQL